MRLGPLSAAVTNQPPAAPPWDIPEGLWFSFHGADWMQRSVFQDAYVRVAAQVIIVNQEPDLRIGRKSFVFNKMDVRLDGFDPSGALVGFVQQSDPLSTRREPSRCISSVLGTVGLSFKLKSCP